MDLKQSIERYFQKTDLDKRIKDVGLYIVREDGIPLYHTVSGNSGDDIAALTSGVWKAAEIMFMRFASSKENLEEFRFQFDCSSSGILIMPLILHNDTLFLTAIFKDATNPGQLKALLKKVAIALTDHIDENYNKVVSRRESADAFESLTDNEIDKAFALAGFN